MSICSFKFAFVAVKILNLDFENNRRACSEVQGERFLQDVMDFEPRYQSQ